MSVTQNTAEDFSEYIHKNVLKYGMYIIIYIHPSIFCTDYWIAGKIKLILEDSGHKAGCGAEL